MDLNKSAFHFIALLLLAIVGFWETYFSQILNDHSRYIHFHAATMMLWMLMLISQSFLIRYKKYSLHRLLGKFSYFLVPVLTVSLILLAHSQITIYDYGLSYRRLYLLFLQLSLLVIFLIAYSMAILYRHSAAYHARYMICTSLTLIDPAIARISIDIPTLPFRYQFVTFGIVDLILVSLIFLERKQKQGRSVFPVMLGVFLLFQLLNLSWTDSQTWDSFALWFAKLELT